MEKIEITLYRYDELSDKAKERAVSDNRESIGCSESSFVDDDYRQTMDAIEEKFGIKIRDLEERGYYRFRFTGGWDEIADESRFLPRYLDRLSDRLHKGKYYSTPMHKDKEGKWNFKKKYSKVLSDDYCCCLTGTYTDFAVEEAMKKRYEYIRKCYTIREFVNDVLDDFCKNWNRDSDDCFTEEHIVERMVEDDYTFLKNGKVFIRETV